MKSGKKGRNEEEDGVKRKMRQLVIKSEEGMKKKMERGGREAVEDRIKKGKERVGWKRRTQRNIRDMKKEGRKESKRR